MSPIRTFPLLLALVLTACATGSDGESGAGSPGGSEASSGSGDTGGGGDGEPDFTSGSRISARSLNGDDGTVSFAGLFDNELGVACTIRPMADGSERCLPAETMRAVDYFSDPNCTQPLGTVYPPGCPAGKYGGVFDYGACASSVEWEIRPVVGPFGGSAVFRLNGATCGTATVSNADVYVLGPAMAPDEFVKFTRE